MEEEGDVDRCVMTADRDDHAAQHTKREKKRGLLGIGRPFKMKKPSPFSTQIFDEKSPI